MDRPRSQKEKPETGKKQLDLESISQGREASLNRSMEVLAMAISQELLEILACPKCKGDIRLNEKGDGLVCGACRLMYPIQDDIPIMLIDEAVKL